jgi:hypothetical protein
MNAELDHFTLTIVRLLDSDMLTESEAAALLAERIEACQAVAEGDWRTARQHVDGVAQLLEALVQSGGLVLADARAVIHAAERIFEPAVDEDAQTL